MLNTNVRWVGFHPPLAYLASSSATKEKSFITLTPGVIAIILFIFASDSGTKYEVLMKYYYSTLF
jgi:hypothetical protein